ncbi:ATP-NAD kinase [Candidatus Bathyarchaeota archaeon]|nr:ATP-NAD kinase [Candidatus Bathyarchaeota archaeon]
MMKVGLIVNPIAGVGGRVGLKGSDGSEIQKMAFTLGATLTSPSRTIDCLKTLYKLIPGLEIITCPGLMGETECLSVGFKPIVIGILKNETTAEDTKIAAIEMLNQKVALILFAGGDGTARDLYSSIGTRLPVIGIPAGVKIHSSVFAVNPQVAGELVYKYLNGEAKLHDAEVLDIDEDAYRENRLSAKLYGFLKTPYVEGFLQASKEVITDQEELNLDAIAREFIEDMDPTTMYILGPGSTLSYITKMLGYEKTLLGVDIIQNGKLIATDLNEAQILETIQNNPAKIVVTVIGGQGFIFGRGNQQISPKVIKKVGIDNIIIIATRAKLASLEGRPLLVDSGDSITDRQLSGYVKVVTDYGRRVAIKVN